MADPRLEQFGRYAKYYDLIYRDKDYKGECDFLETAFRGFSPFPVRKILDIGCGTGRHAFVLAERGYQVCGIDTSNTAVAMAKGKLGHGDEGLSFAVMDVRCLELGYKFDACIAMFAVMDYLTTNHDIQKALNSIRKHLLDGGLFVFDCWNGLAVMRTMPSKTIKRVEGGGISVTRIAEPELDSIRHLCKVRYEMFAVEAEQMVDRVSETHVLRFMFPQEMVHYLHDAGFEVLKICAFPDLDLSVDENVWNMAVVARAQGGIG